MQAHLSFLLLLLFISGTKNYKHSFKLSKNFDDCKDPSADSFGSLVFTSQTKSDHIPGWEVFASIVIPCEEIKSFQIIPSFDIHGGVVRTSRQISSYSGASSESSPVNVKNFIRLWNAGFGRSKNPVVGLDVVYGRGFAKIKYLIANGDMISKLESLKIPYEFQVEKYEVKNKKKKRKADDNEWDIFF